MKTLAAVLTGRKKVEVRELDVPSLKYGQVLVKIVYSGICGAQVEEWKLNKDNEKYLPHCTGHEGVGIVCDCGPGITKVKNGDHVIISWIRGEGINAEYPKYGDVNAGACNTLMEYSIVCENRVYPISTEITKELALIGCALPTGLGSVTNILKPRNVMAVFGCGGVGLSSLLFNNPWDPIRKIAVDCNEERLKVAKELGADIIHPDDVDEDFDYTIISTGNIEGMNHAIHRTIKRACIVGNPPKKWPFLKVDAYKLIYGLELVGSVGGNVDLDNMANIYAEDIIAGKLEVSKIVRDEDVYDIHNIEKAFIDAESGKSIRSIMKLEG